MSPAPSVERLRIEIVPGEAISGRSWRKIVDLCTAAFEMDFEAYLRLLPETTHVLARLDDQIVSHACWVTRWLQPGDYSPVRTAFIEAVATAPSHQGRGYGSAVMQKVADEVTDFELAGLSTGRHSFYERLGWERWLGPLAIRTEKGLLPTPGDHVMVLRLPRTPKLDLEATLTAEWRQGELW